MTNTINTYAALLYVEQLLETAKENLCDPNCALSFALVAATKPNSPPQPVLLHAAHDFEALENSIYANHLHPNCNAPFSLVVSPCFDDAVADELNLVRTTLTVAFRPFVASRQLGWRAPKPPAAPTIVESAKLAKGLWRMSVELQREPLDNLVPPEEAQTIVWGDAHGLDDFKTRLQKTLRGIEYGHDIPNFGEVDDFGALGLPLDNSAVRVTPPAVPRIPSPPGGWKN